MAYADFQRLTVDQVASWDVRVGRSSSSGQHQPVQGNNDANVEEWRPCHPFLITSEKAHMSVLSVYRAYCGTSLYSRRILNRSLRYPANLLPKLCSFEINSYAFYVNSWVLQDCASTRGSFYCDIIPLVFPCALQDHALQSAEFLACEVAHLHKVRVVNKFRMREASSTFKSALRRQQELQDGWSGSWRIKRAPSPHLTGRLPYQSLRGCLSLSGFCWTFGVFLGSVVTFSCCGTRF